MHKEVEKYLSLKRKLIVLEYARVFGSNPEAYKACGIPKSTFYDWKKAFEDYKTYLMFEPDDEDAQYNLDAAEENLWNGY